MKQDHEAISVFDIFKIGVGPSSSHTLGPWRAALDLLQTLANQLPSITQIQIILYGSLAKTGKGHGTDIAVQLGLMGLDPVTCDITKINNYIEHIKNTNTILLNERHPIKFDAQNSIQYLSNESLPFHSNALTFLVDFSNEDAQAYTYYSTGGGFIKKENEIITSSPIVLPYPINTSKELLTYCSELNCSIHEVVLKNELALRSVEDINSRLLHIWRVMQECIYQGCHTQGILPGGLNVRRRARDINKRLIKDQIYNSYDQWIEAIKNSNPNFAATVDWVNCFALAVNEENASFSRVVTAPTNGAAGVIPAVLHYYILFCNGHQQEKIIQFLLTASEIGSIFKKGATISAAMGGCQAEIGVSSAMAAAALNEALGGSPSQAIMAAEIAMEHHLGLTCDPIGGLVQVPCIERNVMGAIKAITAAQLALQSDPAYAKVSLDAVVKTMWDTAKDMNSKYKETAEGGLALNIPLGLMEC